MCFSSFEKVRRNECHPYQSPGGILASAASRAQSPNAAWRDIARSGWPRAEKIHASPIADA